MKGNRIFISALLILLNIVPRYAYGQAILDNPSCSSAITFALYHPNAPTGTSTLRLMQAKGEVEVAVTYSAAYSASACGNGGVFAYSWDSNLIYTFNGGKFVVERQRVSLDKLKKGSYKITLHTFNTNEPTKFLYSKVVTLNIDSSAASSTPTANTSPNQSGGSSSSSGPSTQGSSAGKDTGPVENPNTDVQISIGKSFDTVTFYNPLTLDRPEQLVVRLINILLLLVGILSVIMILFGGFLLASSGGSESQIKKGRQTIIWAVSGLVVSLMAFSIVAIIQSIIS